MADTSAERAHLEELKSLVRLHAGAQGLGHPQTDRVLSRIERATGEGPGAWSTAFIEEAERAGETPTAVALYGLGRFPFVDGPGRALALERCVSLARRLSAREGHVRLEVPYEGAAVPVLAANLSRRNTHTILVMGGIVSLKEQWLSFLRAAPKLRASVVVLDYPGVGESPLRAGPESQRLVSAVLDHLRPFCDTDRTLAVAMSFGGTLLLRAAARDTRLRGLSTVGAPLLGFFPGEGGPGALGVAPRTTRETLAHVMGLDAAAGDALGERAARLGPSAAELAAVRMPVRYYASLRDEIVPAVDWETLRERIAGAEVESFDDVHGSPSHTETIRVEIALDLLRGMGAERGPMARILRALRARHRLRARVRRALSGRAPFGAATSRGENHGQ